MSNHQRARVLASVPGIGHTLALSLSPLEFLLSLPREHDLVEIRLAGRPAFVVCDPRLLAQMLTDDRVFGKGGFLYDGFRAVVGNRAVALRTHDQHRPLRRAMQPAFTRQRIEDYAAIMAEQIVAVTDSWQTGQVIDVPTVMHRIATATALRTLFVDDIDNDMLDEWLTCLFALTEISPTRHLVVPPALQRRLARGSHTSGSTRQQLWRLAERLVHEYRRSGGDQHGLMALLGDHRDHTGNTLTDTDIQAQVVNFMIAGTETLASTMAWIWYVLGTHPPIRQRFSAEVTDVLDGRVARYEDLPRLGLTAAVLTETLRMYPPAWVLTRVANEPVELAGTAIAPGTTLIGSPYLVHHSDNLYPEPGRFDPDRWYRTAARTTATGEFVPFGIGARKCIGDAFAETQAILTTATIGARWQLDPIPGQTTHAVAGASLLARPLKMRVTRLRAG
ncbi:cytochrome P450 [Nocardia sp. NPDC050408]|uniref:cytochrome P450 n=1 Tax=Nocardia sp. NPDC050408 TaxID=3364319 RepID=UPI0037A38F0B